MKRILQFIALILLIISCNSNEEVNPPNVIVILVDDLGYYDLSCMGSKYYETPNIDRIAEEGVIFTQGYSSSRVCSPSRASLMTGKFVTRHGITDYIGAKSGEEWAEVGKKWGRHTKMLPPSYNHELGKDHVTISEAMKSNGYKTFYAGKWHLGGEGSFPEDHGFDINKGGYYAGSPRGGFFSPYNNPKLDDGKDGENLSLRLADETVKFIEQYKDTSFFAMLSFYAVHSPIQTTKSRWEKYRTKANKMGIADSAFSMERRFPIRQTQDNPVYGGLVETVDEAVGNVIACLKRLDLYENTLVIFTSDNGGVSSGDNYSTSLLPLKGGKGYQWEGGIRVPFIVKPPNYTSGGKSIEIPVINTDIFPTVLDYSNLELMEQHHIDGVSIKNLIENNYLDDRELYWHYPHYGNQGGDPSSIIRKGKWKLIHYWDTGIDELYDMSDATEVENIAKKFPDKAHELRSKLLNWLESTNAVYPTFNEKYQIYKADSLFNFRKTVLKSNLEKRRNDMLDADWSPNKDWWGSQVSEE